MNKSIYVIFILFACTFYACKKDKTTSKETQTILLINHTGYETTKSKKVVLQTKSQEIPLTYNLVTKNDEVVFEGVFKSGGKIDNWHTGNAFQGDFSTFSIKGDYFIKTSLNGKEIKSRLFSISDENYAQKSLSLLTEGFETQHLTGDFNKRDAAITFFGDRKDTIDVSGGWYDASGDRGKYLSHLCYSNYFNPQQTPLVVWNMLIASDNLTSPSQNQIKNRIDKEATFGADFLMRMNDEEGYFYTNVFAKWSGEAAQREICAYETQDGNKTTEYQAGFREGGGIAIAALAKASRTLNNGMFTSEQYLQTAIKAFDHLIKYNSSYIDNGKENIIDEYCSLIAAVELFECTNNKKYLTYAQKRAKELSNRISIDEQQKGWWSSDEEGNRPFFHGVESGFPVIALTRYLKIETEKIARDFAIKAIQKSIDFEINISKEVHNPFGYARQYIKAIDETKNRSAFFIPHQNETGYWWQGENSRLASIASSFYMAKEYLTEEQQDITAEMAANQMNWILGLNPYDTSMVDGLGYNNPDYFEDKSLNFKGGVANGITAGFIDETDVAFMPLPYNNDGGQKWRWSEQWIPHAAWLILAVATENN